MIAAHSSSHQASTSKLTKAQVLMHASGFTLVELLVVIAVVAVLGTIGFLSLRNVNEWARDATRISDIKNVTTSLGAYLTQNGVVPHPTNETTITYSGATIWYQGTLGTSVIIPLGNPSKRPLDPMLDKEYTYSVTADESQYQLSGIFEGDSFVYRSFIPTASAASNPSTKYKFFVHGNYNWGVLKTWSAIIAVPSLILGDTSTPASRELTQMGGYNFVIKNGYLPPSALKSVVNTNIVQADKPYIPAYEALKNNTQDSVIVWTGSTLPKTTADVVVFSSNLKTAYNGAPLSSNMLVNDIMTTSGDLLTYKASLLLNAQFSTKINIDISSLLVIPPAILEPCTFSPTGTGWLLDNCSL